MWIDRALSAASNQLPAKNKYSEQVADFIAFNENFFAKNREVTEKETIGALTINILDRPAQ